MAMVAEGRKKILFRVLRGSGIEPKDMPLHCQAIVEEKLFETSTATPAKKRHPNARIRMAMRAMHGGRR